MPVPIGDEDIAFRVWKACFDRGLYMNPIVPPAVPSRRSLLRASTMVTHSADQIDRALATKALVLLLAVFGMANLWMAIAADVGTSLLVVANAMRLLRRRP